MSSICLTSLDVLDILVDVSSFVDFLRGTAFSGDCDLGLGELCFSGDFDLRFLFGDFFPASSSENFICKEENTKYLVAKLSSLAYVNMVYFKDSQWIGGIFRCI